MFVPRDSLSHNLFMCRAFWREYTVLMWIPQHSEGRTEIYVWAEGEKKKIKLLFFKQKEKVNYS